MENAELGMAALVRCVTLSEAKGLFAERRCFAALSMTRDNSPTHSAIAVKSELTK